MELIDIINENNELTGEKQDRKTIHKNKMWHRHVNCWIMNKNGEILLQKRAACKATNPNQWATTGGHVITGETTIEGVLREINEELGIQLSDSDMELIDIHKIEKPSSNCFEYEYFTTVDYPIDQYKIQEEELSDVKYVSIEDVVNIRNNKDQNYMLTQMDDERFNNEINMLKEKRNKLL